MTASHMTSRERIKRTLDFQLPDKVGIYDYLQEATRESWQKQNLLPKEQSYQDFFSYDLRLFEFDQSFLLTEKQLDVKKIRQKWQSFKALLTPCDERINNFFKTEYKTANEKAVFLALGFLDPFEAAAATLGLENLLMLIAEDPDFVRDFFTASTELSISMSKYLRQKNFIFDGAWLWSDIAYKEGSYFSSQTYKNLLYPSHKKLCSYFNSAAMPVIFHCDGNLLGLLPLLLKAGIRALNPLEMDCGFNLEFMKTEYGKDLVLFGNMPTDVLEKDKRQIEIVFSKRLDIAKTGGGFIYHGDKPIPPTVSFENYEFALDMVKKYGAY